MANVGSVIGLWIGIIVGASALISSLFITTFKVWRSVQNNKMIEADVKAMQLEMKALSIETKAHAENIFRELKAELNKGNDAQWETIRTLEKRIYDHVRDCNKK